MVPESLLHLAETECWMGRCTAADQYVEELVEAVEQTGQYRWRGLARYAEALVAARLGQIGRAEAAIDAGLELSERLDDSLVRVLHLSVRGFLKLSSGSPRDADRYLTEASVLVMTTGIRETARFTFDGDQIEAALAVGALDRAVVLLDQLRERTQRSPDRSLSALTARCTAQVAMAVGDLTGAATAADEACTAYQQLPMPFELARTQLVQGQVLRRLRQRRAAQQTLGQAEAIFVELGAVLWVPRATSELRRLGLRHGDPGRLTPTEERVAHLVAEGHGNSEVAAALLISRRTVENHLSRIYRKLGVASRTELALTIRGRLGLLNG